MKIFILKDEKQELNKLYYLIIKYLYFRNYDINIEVIIDYYENILDYIEKNNVVGIYFTYKNLNSDIDEIELVSKIRQYDSVGKIAFVSTNIELSYLIYTHKDEDVDYISKEDNEQFIFEIINCIEVVYKRYITKQKLDKKSFIIKSKGKQIRVYNNEVNFIESSHVAHKLIIHSNERLIEFYGRIKDLDKKFENFCRCHQSYVVNVDNIDFIDTKSREIVMKNGKVCYSSIRYIKDLLKVFENIQD